MFIHRAKIQFKPNSFIELDRKIKDSIMPALRLQKGFCSGVTLIDTIWLTATEDTRWETRKDAEAYHLNGFPETKKLFSEFNTAEPTASIFEDPDSALTQKQETFPK